MARGFGDMFMDDESGRSGSTPAQTRARRRNIKKAQQARRKRM
jgi:hypothetical protein